MERRVWLTAHIRLVLLSGYVTQTRRWCVLGGGGGGGGGGVVCEMEVTTCSH